MVNFPYFGAHPDANGTTIRVWAPHAETLAVHAGGASIPMTSGADAPVEGVYTARIDGGAGTRYWIEMDGADRFPDPASRFQPEGVHGPSKVVDPSAYTWETDGWTGTPQEDLVIYELHVGTFSDAGTYEGVRERLPYLSELGVTAIELMPVHAFPGQRNWGYDPAALFAPASPYGTPDDLRRLVDDAHRHGLSVLLDVIYNHLGPDGAYANAFAPFLTDADETPWGASVNLDGDGSAGVRQFFLDNALHWLTEYRIDGLRLDATHALHDASTPHFLAELSEAVESHVEGPPRHLIAEDHRNLNTLLQPRNAGGMGLDGVWSGDLHHQLRHLTAGDDEAYFQDFVGTTTREVAVTLRDGWYFRGEPSAYWGESRGTDPASVERSACVVFIQNHDQVGNRPQGDRLTESIDRATYRALSALLCFAEEVPLLFMGQEWAATTPFLFFTDHPEAIGRRVTEGRRDEFEGFSGFDGTVPDPQDEATFLRSRLDWTEPETGAHARIRALYRDLLDLRTALGPAEDITASTPTTLRMRRAPYVLLVNLKGEATMGVDRHRGVVLHTEMPSYAVDPKPPVLRQSRLTMPRPMAVLLRDADLTAKAGDETA